jgi:uncharacterized protein YecE (DUF72 family)
MSGRILVGTSSWADPGFVVDWYPPGMPARDRLAWYAERFEAVEVNSTFYAIPATGTVARWSETTPPDFRFDVKLHRLLSRHSADVDSLPKELRNEVRTTSRGRVVLDEELEARLADATLAALEPLTEGGKLGALLLQLSPAFGPRDHRLEELAPLLERLAPARVAIELRNRGWVDERRVADTLSFFSEHGAAWVGVDAPRADHFTIMPPLDAVTRDDLAYIRAHGRNADGYLHGKSVAERFGWRYSDEELEEIGQRARGLAEEADEVHVMFNNNSRDDAPVAARRMRELLGQDPGPPPDRAGAQLRMG